MSRVELLEQKIEELTKEEFNQLASWIRTKHQLAHETSPQGLIRDHTAFLRSYSSEDEGLYDDAIGR